MSAYSVVLHVIILLLIAVVAWQFFAARRKRAKEAELVEKYRPSMQRVCDDLGVRIEINDFDDLLNAFEQIATKPTSTESMDR